MVHAPEEQAGADEENKGEGDLDDDQETSGCVTAADGAARVLFEASAEAGAGGVKRGDEADDDTEDSGDRERKEEDAAVEADSVDAGKAGRAVRDEGFDSACGDEGSAECAEMARRRLSVRSWRISRALAAPRAARMENSARRWAARASRRLVTLTQAMKRMSATAPRTASKAGRTAWVISC